MPAERVCTLIVFPSRVEVSQGYVSYIPNSVKVSRIKCFVCFDIQTEADVKSQAGNPNLETRICGL